MFFSGPEFKKYFRASASLIAFPVITICGFALFTCFWLIFLWKTGPNPPITRDLNFILNHERSCLHSNSLLLSFPSNSLIEIEFTLRFPENLGSNSPSHPYSLTLSFNDRNEGMIFNFLPRYRSFITRSIRSFIKLPLYIILGHLEEEIVHLRTKTKIISGEVKGQVMIEPPLPLYESQVKIYPVQSGISRIVHSWKVVFSLLFIIFNLFINLIISISISLLLFYFSLRGGYRQEAPLENLEISSLFDENAFE